MAISKSKRFDIFRRDGFTCQYCGRRPPDVVLEVDHLQPVSKGGTDEDLNLVTSCWDCNRGKAAKVLGEGAPKPDADLEFLAIQQETAELRRYLAAKEERDDALLDVIVELARVWNEYLNPVWIPSEAQFKSWLRVYTPEEVEDAIMRAHPAFRSRRVQGTDTARYVSGVLRRMREEGG